ncbi:MAG: hypothetical protein M3355_12105 [Actinomycetota bacterium]|nr:hypothetical protein [Actinomycetota bacterium]
MPTTWQNVAHLLGGKYVRVFRAPTSATYTGKLSDIFSQIAEEGTVSGTWLNIGYVGDASYSQEIEENELAIRGEIVAREPVSTVRRFTTELHEVSADHLQLVHPGSTLTTVAGTANTDAANKRVRCNVVKEFPRVRIAFVGQRKVSLGGAVTHGSMSRGRYVAAVFPAAEIVPEENEVEFSEDGFATIPVTFEAYTDTTLNTQVDWITEDAGAIPTV